MSVAAAALLLAAEPVAAFAEVPGVSIDWYDVEGTTADAIRASLDVRRPTDPTDGRRVDALTRWSISWQWLGGPDDPCGLSHATIAFAASVRLPRLRSPVDRRLRARWTAYVAALARHEARHVRGAYDARGEVLAAIRGATCASANAAGEAALAGLHARDHALDLTTEHGVSEGARFP